MLQRLISCLSSRTPINNNNDRLLSISMDVFAAREVALVLGLNKSEMRDPFPLPPRNHQAKGSGLWYRHVQIYSRMNSSRHSWCHGRL